MVKYEKPQKKNRHLLAIRQHVFPRASIVRFVGIDGKVFLSDRSGGRRAKPDDKSFSAPRSWDHRVERGFMKDTEDAFQCLASSIIGGAVLGIGDAEKSIVNRFYALWYMRTQRRKLPALQIQGPTSMGQSLTPEQEDNLEINGYSFCRLGGRVPARHLNGFAIQILSVRFADDMLGDAHWGIVRAQDGEFIVPDSPIHTIVPLTPALCLISPADDGIIPRENVAAINRGVRGASKEYFFCSGFV